MEVIHVRYAGLDLSKRKPGLGPVAGTPGRRKTVTTWRSITNQVLALRDHLGAQQETCAVMEAIGTYQGCCQEPHPVWPEDQAWCMACEVDEEVTVTPG